MTGLELCSRSLGSASLQFIRVNQFDVRAFMQLLKASARPPALAERAALRSQSAASCWVTPLLWTLPVDGESAAGGAGRLSAGAVRFSY